jgi:hypothetical protein
MSEDKNDNKTADEILKEIGYVSGKNTTTEKLIAERAYKLGQQTPTPSHDEKVEEIIKKRIEDIALEKSSSPSDWQWIEQYMLEGYERAKKQFSHQQHPQLKTSWISVKDRPLFTIDEKGNWECTEDGDREFIAAVPYNSTKHPDKDLWWIRHCVIEDEIGLCVVCEDSNEPAGWGMEAVEFYYHLLPNPPTTTDSDSERGGKG